KSILSVVASVAEVAAFIPGPIGAAAAPKVARASTAVRAAGSRAGAAVSALVRDGRTAIAIVRSARGVQGMAPGIGRELIVSQRAATWAGRLWTVGGRSTSIGRRISRSGLQQYRPPVFKPNLGYRQANFENR